MPDNQLDILIKFGLSKEKATEAVAEIKKIETATGAVTEKTAKLTDESERRAEKALAEYYSSGTSPVNYSRPWNQNKDKYADGSNVQAMLSRFNGHPIQRNQFDSQSPADRAAFKVVMKRGLIRNVSRGMYERVAQ